MLGAIDVGPSTVGTPPEGAEIGALNASYELTALGTIDRYGRGDDARSPADGHELLAFEVSTGPGELPLPTATPTVQVQVDDDEPRDVGTIIDGSSPVVMSVPADAESVDLVVTDAETTQRLSLLDGSPGDGNIPVLTRDNREQMLGTALVVRSAVLGADADGLVLHHELAARDSGVLAATFVHRISPLDEGGERAPVSDRLIAVAQDLAVPAPPYAATRTISLDADAVGDLADREGLAHAATAAGDHHALERLQTGLLTFAYPYHHLDRIACIEAREILAEVLTVYLCQNIFSHLGAPPHCGGQRVRTSRRRCRGAPLP